MPTTSPDSIYYADGTTPASLADITSAMATSVQNALNLREGHSFKWANATEKSAQSGMAKGDIGYQVDNDTFYIYNGLSWKIWAKELTAYSPTFTAFTPSSSTFTYSISGGIVRVFGKAVCSATLPTGAITLTTPDGYNIDMTTLGAVQAAIIGTGGIDDISQSVDYLVGVRAAASTSVTVIAYSASGASVATSAITSINPLTWATGDTLYVNFSYPVA